MSSPVLQNQRHHLNCVNLYMKENDNVDVDNRLTYISGIGVEGIIDGIEGVIFIDVEYSFSDIGVEGAIGDADNRLTYISVFGIGVEGATDDVEAAIVVNVEATARVPNPLLIWGL